MSLAKVVSGIIFSGLSPVRLSSLPSYKLVVDLYPSPSHCWLYYSCPHTFPEEESKIYGLGWKFLSVQCPLNPKAMSAAYDDRLFNFRV